MTAEELATKGGEAEGYKWKQDGEEVELTVPLRAEVKKGDIKVKFGTQTLAVHVVGQAPLDLRLYGKVTPDGCNWQLSGSDLLVTLEKGTEGETWPAVVVVD